MKLPIGYDVANTNREQWVVGVLCYACMGVWEVSRPGEWTISVCCVIKVSLVDWKCYGWAQHHHQGAGVAATGMSQLAAFTPGCQHRKQGTTHTHHWSYNLSYL